MNSKKFNRNCNSRSKKLVGATSTHDCGGKTNQFCYICGKFEISKNRRTITERIKNIYKNCFDCEISNQETNWVPHSICSPCNIMLCRWEKNQKCLTIRFKVPMIWRISLCQDQCYFCMTNLTGFNKNNKSKITYADVETVTKSIIASTNPVSEIEDLDIEVMRSFKSLSIHEPNETESASDDDNDSNGSKQSDKTFKLRNTNKVPQIFTQQKLSDLIRDLGLPKDGAEYLTTTRLKKEEFIIKRSNGLLLSRSREEFPAVFLSK